MSSLIQKWLFSFLDKLTPKSGIEIIPNDVQGLVAADTAKRFIFQIKKAIEAGHPFKIVLELLVHRGYSDGQTVEVYFASTTPSQVGQVSPTSTTGVIPTGNFDFAKTNTTMRALILDAPFDFLEEVNK